MGENIMNIIAAMIGIIGGVVLTLWILPKVLAVKCTTCGKVYSLKEWQEKGCPHVQ
jgi:uncharacterized protein with PQ loop repeat